MNTTLTLAEIGAIIIGLALLTLLIYLTLLIKNFIPSVKKINSILDDVEKITAVASDSTETIQVAVGNISKSVSIMTDSIRGNQNIVAAITSLINAITALKNLIQHNTSK